MKKFFMFLAVAGFFSMTTISCGEKKADDATEQHEGEGDAEHSHEGEGDHGAH